MQAGFGTRTEYATRKGKSKAWVTKMGHADRVVEVTRDGTKLVDFAATDAKIAQTSVLSMQRSADVANINDVFRKAQTQERVHSARLKELLYKEKAGELVPIAEIRAAYARRMSSMRDALLQIPARLAPVLAAETNEAAVHEALQDELYLVLTQVADE